ncbi:hypothetical protein WJX77_003393 [Trebouxia sp. C0004]
MLTSITQVEFHEEDVLNPAQTATMPTEQATEVDVVAELYSADLEITTAFKPWLTMPLLPPANVSRNQQKRSQHRALLKDQIEDGLSQHVPTIWKMTCFSVAEAMPEDFSYQPRVKNEVNGDVSFEEVRWADYQEPNKQFCIARFAEANRQKHLQFEALKRCQLAPSAGGPPLAEPTSPYVISALPGASGSAAILAPSGAPSQLVPSGPFAHAQPGSFGGAGSFGPTAQQPFGVPAQPQVPPPAQPSQPGRIQFGQKAGQPASNPFGRGSSQPGRGQSGPNAVQSNQNPFGQSATQPRRLQFGARAGQPAAAQFGTSQPAEQPFGFQSKPSQPFRKPFNSTEDPFGRQKSGQAQGPAQQSPSSNPFSNQQLLPTTPAVFGAFGGPSQPSFGQSFQTPAVQQRPAFAGGIAISPQTLMPDDAGSLQSRTPDAASNSLQHQGTISSNQKAHDASCIWDDEDFVIGKIPEDPPPFELCH